MSAVACAVAFVALTAVAHAVLVGVFAAARVAAFVAVYTLEAFAFAFAFAGVPVYAEAPVSERVGMR